MNTTRKILLVGIAVLGARPCYAEDVSAAMATLNDPAAECAYLEQKLATQKRAQAVVRELNDLFITAFNKASALPEGSSAREEEMSYAEMIEQKKGTAVDLALEADTDVLATESEITARRGSLNQCKGDTEQVSPSETEEGSPLEAEEGFPLEEEAPAE